LSTCPFFVEVIMRCPIFGENLTYCLESDCNYFDRANEKCEYMRLVQMRKDEERERYINRNRLEHQAVEHG